ncbi:SMAD/FHA domain-containing protein [Piptocephalis cylindrospora]|uniref:SMAD/FHA domain-containing protein n=1 Tax=Piptocephalis cylindrospora TaxID=1907219 RepID=A0A4P9XY22_9FUNG|nr:SMAD/FHA domain-containing protein [Piptocephalis cylindrospora]|eukprot:RKP11353.1 SMAD/FHA domain-containing protein [Piptocephalis cylindrospora]
MSAPETPEGKRSQLTELISPGFKISSPLRDTQNTQATQATQPYENSQIPASLEGTPDWLALIPEDRQPYVAGRIVVKTYQNNAYAPLYTDVELIVGRNAHCDLVVEGQFCSSKHCVFAVRNGVIVCKDISSNGTMYNGTKIGKGQTVALEDGDIIEIHDKNMLQVEQIMEETAKVEAKEYRELVASRYLINPKNNW